MHQCYIAKISHSQTICWLNLSQQPEIMPLQARLYEQLSGGDEVPAKATKSVERMVEELRQVAATKLVLVVLDGGYPSFC